MARMQVPTDQITSERMKRVRRRHTKPEVKLRKMLWSLGLRYRCNFAGLPGSPDLVNRREGWAIFVNGCFWHGHQGCKRATTPKRNNHFWEEKISANRQRDMAKVAALQQLGLEVVTVWECEIEKIDALGLHRACPQLLALLDRLKARQIVNEE